MNTVKPPVTKNQTIELTIDAIGHDGQGIGKYQGFTVFVTGALPGEKIDAKIIKIQKNYAIAKLLTVKSESDSRIQPRCEIFGRCGGCQLQHLDYQAQLAFKRQLVIDNLERIGKLNLEQDNIIVHPTIGMDNPWFYRNKAQVPVGNDVPDELQGDSQAGKLITGFYAARSHRIIPFDECYIQHNNNNTLIAEIRETMKKHHISAYDEQSHKGLLRHIIVRTAFQTDQVMVVIVINGNSLPQQQIIIDEISKLSNNIKSICLNINKSKTNTIFGDKTKVVYGENKITDSIGGIDFGISARSFYQVNPIQTEVLYKKALEYAGLTGTETVIDAYCGIGTITLFLAQKAAKVYGVEIVPEAIEDAKYNAKLNKIDNVEFIVAKAEEWIPKMFGSGKNNADDGNKPSVIVVDPPRKGCDEELLDAIIDMQIERIVYVSCNPSTLARDLKILVDGGYKVQEVQPVDMFSQTSHVECVILMQRSGLKDKK